MGRSVFQSSGKRLFAFGGEGDGKSFELWMHKDLTTQSGIVFYKKSLIEHVFFIVACFFKLMIAFEVTVAGGAHRHATTGTFYG